MAALTQIRIGQPLQVNRVRSIRPSARKARDRALPDPDAASLRKMTEGITLPAWIEALRRMSTAHWLTTAAVSTMSPISGSSIG